MPPTSAIARDLGTEWGRSPPGIERLARRRFSVAVDRALDREVGRDGIVDEEEVALRAAVGADLRPAPLERRRSTASGISREPLQVAAAVDVGEATDRDRKLRYAGQ